MRVNDPTQFGRVAVLLGGDSPEREISLLSGEAVLQALLQRGVDAIAFDPAREPLTRLTTNGVRRVWNALHGGDGEGGIVQGALQVMGLPYTGSGVLGSALAMDKVRSKILFEAAGLATPQSRTPTSVAELDAVVEELGLPLVVKPAADGSSVAISRVDHAGQLPDAWHAAHAAGGVVLVEQLIDGPEYTAGILGDQVLPLIRIETPRVFYDYEAKYYDDHTQYHCPCGLSAKREQQLQQQCMRAFDAVGGHGWGRVDLIVDGDDVPQFLEVNTIPGMTSHSLVPKAAAQLGIDFETLVWRILETAECP